jgi:hypothetical protein
VENDDERTQSSSDKNPWKTLMREPNQASIKIHGKRSYKNPDKFHVITIVDRI